MPPRNVLQTGGYVPNLQPNSHRTASQQSQVQSMTPQTTPGFMQARGQGSFGFGGGALGQHQASAPLQQQQQLSSQQQQQTNGTSTPMPPHLAQSSVIGTPSISSSTEVSLDPNDFPVLGSTPTNNTSSSSTAGATAAGGTSYASQAGTGVSLAGSGAGGIGSGSGNQPRDFTPDDFPALGGQSHTNQNQSASQNQNSNQESIPHPPGLNGFQPQEFQQRSRTLLGELTGGIPQGTPGMLNLGPQARNVHPGFQQNQTESDKQQRVSVVFLMRFPHCILPFGQPPSREVNWSTDWKAIE
jgi:CCR4-NOT transcription complex subunit 2